MSNFGIVWYMKTFLVFVFCSLKCLYRKACIMVEYKLAQKMIVEVWCPVEI